MTQEIEAAFERIRAVVVVKEMATAEAWGRFDRVKKTFPYSLSVVEKNHLADFLEAHGHDDPVLFTILKKIEESET